MIGLYRDGRLWPGLSWPDLGSVPEGAVGIIAMGWELVEIIAKPADTVTDTFDASNVDGVLTWTARAKTGDELDRARREGLRTLVGEGIPWLRTRAEAARTAVVTQGNAVVVLQAIVKDLGMFLDRFADYLEGSGVDD